MNLRCIYCQTPFTLSRAEMAAAIQHMTEKNMNHYDAHCPRCRRATRVPRQRLEMAMPNWREELKQFESEMKKNPQQEAPTPTHEPVVAAAQAAPVAKAAPKPEPKTAKAKQPAAKQSPAKEKPAKASPAKDKKASATKEKKTTKKSK